MREWLRSILQAMVGRTWGAKPCATSRHRLCGSEHKTQLILKLGVAQLGAAAGTSMHSCRRKQLQLTSKLALGAWPRCVLSASASSNGHRYKSQQLLLTPELAQASQGAPPLLED